MDLLGNKQIQDFLATGKITIKGFDPGRMDLVSYLPRFRPLAKRATIEGGTTLRLASEETFSLNPEVVGFLYPTAETVAEDLLLIHGGIVHPLFTGRLALGLFNAGKKKIEWTADRHPARLVFFDLPYQPKRFSKDEAGARARHEFILKRAKTLEEELTKEGPSLGHD